MDLSTSQSLESGTFDLPIEVPETPFESLESESPQPQASTRLGVSELTYKQRC